MKILILSMALVFSFSTSIFAHEDGPFSIGLVVNGVPVELYCTDSRLQSDVLLKGLDAMISAFKKDTTQTTITLVGERGSGTIYNRDAISATYVKNLSVESCAQKDKKKEPTGKWVMVTTYCNRWCGGHSQWQYVR